MKSVVGVRLLAAACVFVSGAIAAAPSTSSRATYLVALSDPPLAAHMAERARAAGVAADDKRAVRSTMRSAEADAYLH
jgi:hypothetical protein